MKGKESRDLRMAKSLKLSQKPPGVWMFAVGC